MCFGKKQMLDQACTAPAFLEPKLCPALLPNHPGHIDSEAALRLAIQMSANRRRVEEDILHATSANIVGFGRGSLVVGARVLLLNSALAEAAPGLVSTSLDIDGVNRIGQGKSKRDRGHDDGDEGLLELHVEWLVVGVLGADGFQKNVEC